jgi:NAD(P)-dependent dehydrogenase (short-subunit alcohol dehydrogenase family)
MNQLTKSLAAEWVSDKIRVNCVAPGLINTDMAKGVHILLHIETQYIYSYYRCLHEIS